MEHRVEMISEETYYSALSMHYLLETRSNAMPPGLCNAKQCVCEMDRRQCSTPDRTKEKEAAKLVQSK
jgi:hypothetical protein